MARGLSFRRGLPCYHLLPFGFAALRNVPGLHKALSPPVPRLPASRGANAAVPARRQTALVLPGALLGLPALGASSLPARAQAGRVHDAALRPGRRADSALRRRGRALAGGTRGPPLQGGRRMRPLLQQLLRAMGC